MSGIGSPPKIKIQYIDFIFHIIITETGIDSAECNPDMACIVSCGGIPGTPQCVF
jgi:hypothetical protein